MLFWWADKKFHGWASTCKILIVCLILFKSKSFNNGFLLQMRLFPTRLIRKYIQFMVFVDMNLMIQTQMLMMSVSCILMFVWFSMLVLRPFAFHLPDMCTEFTKIES